jgi:hypothetical protein
MSAWVFCLGKNTKINYEKKTVVGKGHKGVFMNKMLPLYQATSLYEPHFDCNVFLAKISNNLNVFRHTCAGSIL